jgi:hypothetical protein
MKLKENGFYRWFEQALGTLACKTEFVRVLQFAYNITQTHFQRPRDTQKDINCWHPEATLNLAHVNGINVNSFSQLFLSQGREFPIFTDAFTEMFSVFFCDHSWPISQAGNANASQILLAIIFSLRSSVNALKEESE